MQQEILGCMHFAISYVFTNFVKQKATDLSRQTIFSTVKIPINGLARETCIAFLFLNKIRLPKNSLNTEYFGNMQTKKISARCLNFTSSSVHLIEFLKVQENKVLFSSQKLWSGTLPQRMLNGDDIVSDVHLFVHYFPSLWLLVRGEKLSFPQNECFK